MMKQFTTTFSEIKSIIDCLKRIEDTKRGFILICDDSSNLIGCLTDGDIRRILLQGVLPTSSPESYINRELKTLSLEHTKEQALRIFDQGCRFIPILKDKKLIDVLFPEDLKYEESQLRTVRAKAPVRISFGGGGTDLTTHFIEHGGAVFNSAISLYAHATLQTRSDKKIVLNSHDFNLSLEVDDISKLQYDGKLDLFKSIIKLLNPSFGFDLTVYCDFPPQSGLGGSSAVLAAIISCFNECRSHKLDRFEIAELAFQAERIEMSISGGWQDQYASVFGGFNFLEFSTRKNEIFPLKVASSIKHELEERMILCYSGTPHPHNSIHERQKMEMKKDDKIQQAKRTVEIAYEMKSKLLRGDIDSLGELIHEAWLLKKSFSSAISNQDLDALYDFTRKNGSLGGKIMGAGGGGFYLFLAASGKKPMLMKVLKEKGFQTQDFCFDEKGVRAWTV